MLGVGVYQHHDDNKVTPSTGDHSGNEITVINLWIILLIGCLFISRDEKRCVSNNFGNRFGTWSLQFLFIDVDFFFNLTGKHFIYVYYSYMEYLLCCDYNQYSSNLFIKRKVLLVWILWI